MPKGRPAGCASQRRLRRCDPNGGAIGCAPRLASARSHPTHLTRKVRQAAWLNDAAQSGYFDAGLSIEFSEWLIAVNGAMQLFQIAGVARQALGRPLGEELGNFLAGEQLAEQRPVTVVEAGVFKQISQGANDGGKRA